MEYCEGVDRITLRIADSSSYLTVGPDAVLRADREPGEFDLSVGSVLGLCALSVPLMMSAGVPAALAILIGFLIAATIGAINGVLVTRTRAPSFIVTLGALFFWRGVVLMLTGGFPVLVNRDDPVFQIFSAELGGFNVSIIWMIGVLIVLSFVLHRTQFGEEADRAASS